MWLSFADMLSSHFGQMFHLTGSRVFGGATSTSDWDFFTQVNSQITKRLKDAGFLPLEEDLQENYSSQEICLVMRGYIAELGYIDVQLVNNVDRKLAAQNLLLGRHGAGKYLSKLEKPVRRAIWDLAIMAVSP